MRKSAVTLGLAAALLLGAECYGQSASNPSFTPDRVVVSPAERAALIAIYQRTGGTAWKNHEGWLGPPGTECTWHGVQCRPKGGLAPATLSITGLELSDNNLVGRIPDVITSLIHLDDLHVVGNRLSGKLPDSFIRRWLANSIWLVADIPQVTDVSEIDFEFSPTSVLCGRHRIILRADKSVLDYAVLCRDATPDDRATYCEVKQGFISWREFARLALSLEKNGYFALRKEYDKSITHGVFESTRVTREGKEYEVVDYAEAGPLALWTMHRSIEGVASLADWEKTEKQPQCPRWDRSEATPKQ